MVHLTLDGAAAGIEFYRRAFGAIEVSRIPSPDGRLFLAELRIGDTLIMIADEMPVIGSRPPVQGPRSAVLLLIFCDDADAAFLRAIEAGAVALIEPTTLFSGDRYARVRDPFGHEWGLVHDERRLSTEAVSELADKALR